MSKLGQRIAEARAWLHQTEIQLTKPLCMYPCTKDVIDAKLKEHEEVQKAIQEHSSNISDVLDFAKSLLSDNEAKNGDQNIICISIAINAVEKGWKNVVQLAADKGSYISAWVLTEQALAIWDKQKEWLLTQEKALKELYSHGDQKSQKEIQSLISKVEVAFEEYNLNFPDLVILNRNVEKLSGMPFEDLQLLKDFSNGLLHCWHRLKLKANSIIHKLDSELQKYREFVIVYRKIVAYLTQVEVRLIKIQHLATAKPRDCLQQLEQLETDMELYNGVLQDADQLGLIVMQQSKPEELPATQKMIGEYQLLWKDIKARIAALKLHYEEDIKAVLDQGASGHVEGSVHSEQQHKNDNGSSEQNIVA